MGWASGSELFNEVISVLKKHVPDEATRKEMYVSLIEAFENEDWDTQDECEGKDPAYDAALMQLHPECFEDRRPEDEE